MHLAAAEWILPLPCHRKSGICMADKGLMLAMWKHAPYKLRGHATGKQVFVSRRQLAEETGQTLSAVKDQLRRLTAAGWVRIDGGGWALAWVTPFEVEAVTPVADKSPTRGDSSHRHGATQVTDTGRLKSPAEVTQVAASDDSNRRPSEQASIIKPIEHSNEQAKTEQVGDGHTQTGRKHDQPALPLPGADPPPPPRPKPPPRADDLPSITAWWQTFNEIRIASHLRWHGSAPRGLGLDENRLRNLRDRLDEAEPGKPIDAQLAAATHVLNVIVAWVDRDEGKMIPRSGQPDYNSMERLHSDYWLRPQNFKRALEREVRTSTDRVRTGYFGGSGHGSKAIHRRRAEELRREAAARGEVIPDHEPMPPGWMDEL